MQLVGPYMGKEQRVPKSQVTHLLNWAICSWFWHIGSDKGSLFNKELKNYMATVAVVWIGWFRHWTIFKNVVQFFRLSTSTQCTGQTQRHLLHMLAPLLIRSFFDHLIYSHHFIRNTPPPSCTVAGFFWQASGGPMMLWWEPFVLVRQTASWSPQWPPFSLERRRRTKHPWG